MASSSTATSPIGCTILDEYESLDVIGNGSFGIIRKVRRKVDNVILARKELHFERMTERDRKQIVAEVNILKELSHENIVRYHDRFVDRDNGILYILMEFCSGGDLSSIIKQSRRLQRPIPEDTVWGYFFQILLALHHCHVPTAGGRQQVLHRDLKPENVFLDPNNAVKLGDFGLAKQMGPASFANTYVGTPYYMSPELIEEKAYDTKSDIWSLGCLIYELCALNPPFHEAQTHQELAVCIKNGRIPPLPKGYSQTLNLVIRAMLNLNPAARPSTHQLLKHEKIDHIRNVTETARMAGAVKVHRDNVISREQAVARKEEELLALAAELQAQATRSTPSEEQLRALVMAHEAEFKIAMERREEEIQSLWRKREAELKAEMESREAVLKAWVVQREDEIKRMWDEKEEGLRKEMEKREESVRAMEEAVKKEAERVKMMKTESSGHGRKRSIVPRVEEPQEAFPSSSGAFEHSPSRPPLSSRGRSRTVTLSGPAAAADLNKTPRATRDKEMNAAFPLVTPTAASTHSPLSPPSPMSTAISLPPISSVAMPSSIAASAIPAVPGSAMKGVVFTETGDVLSTPAPSSPTANQLASMLLDTPVSRINFKTLFEDHLRQGTTNTDSTTVANVPQFHDVSPGSSTNGGFSAFAYPSASAIPLPTGGPSRLRRISSLGATARPGMPDSATSLSAMPPGRELQGLGRRSHDDSRFGAFSQPLPTHSSLMSLPPPAIYDLDDDENLPSPFLKRVERLTHATQGTKLVLADGSNHVNATSDLNGSDRAPSSSITKLLRRPSGHLLRAVAAVNSVKSSGSSKTTDSAKKGTIGRSSSGIFSATAKPRPSVGRAATGRT